MPIQSHRRYDIYQKMISTSTPCNELVKDTDEFKFGTATVKGLQIFFKTQLCFAFTNIKCVLPGRRYHFKNISTFYLIYSTYNLL